MPQRHETPAARRGGGAASQSPRERAASLGRKIRRLRRQHKLTCDQLSARIGLQSNDLSRIEKGESLISLDVLLRILAELGAGAEDLLASPAAARPGGRRRPEPV